MSAGVSSRSSRSNRNFPSPWVLGPREFKPRFSSHVGRPARPTACTRHPMTLSDPAYGMQTAAHARCVLCVWFWPTFSETAPSSGPGPRRERVKGRVSCQASWFGWRLYVRRRPVAFCCLCLFCHRASSCFLVPGILIPVRHSDTRCVPNPSDTSFPSLTHPNVIERNRWEIGYQINVPFRGVFCVFCFTYCAVCEK